MNNFFLSAFLLTFSAQSFATNLSTKALSYVPGGSVVESRRDEVKVKTPAGTIVEIEFNRQGQLDEASGDLIELDIFVPGTGYKNLDEVTEIVKEKGYQLAGDWSYEFNFKQNWHYEVDAFKNGQSFEIEVDAKTGAITRSRIDD